jgi:uncharacterized protein YbaR (Trm112 family)
MPVAPQLLAILVCPKCKGELEYREAEHSLICHTDRLRFEIRDDIPIMLIDEAKPV